MTGADVIYGEGQNDQIIGGYGNDWISGGTGDDAVLGDDGLIFASRNNALGEPLNGIAGLTAAQRDVTITTPGNMQTAVINVTGQLKYAVDLTPFSDDPNWNALKDEFNGPGSTQSITTVHNDDIIFGGLGSDSIHGGSGDDALSGTEASVLSFGQQYDINGNLIGTVEIDYSHPFNPGNELAFNPVDVDGKHHDKRSRAGEFALYDEYDPMRSILLNADGSLNKTNSGMQFFLNNNATEGPLDTKWDPANAQNPTDGDDILFGDNGNDWIVGGTGRDDMFGGWGNDLLNADDVLTTNGGLNNVPESSPSWEDRAYGGAGKDVLIANTGGDRLIDWVGEFNSYLVPFSPFGMATVSRTNQPQLPEYLYALSANDGADFTRAVDAHTDPVRNGEPAGELGLIRQSDKSQWHDQTGAPTDPQAGNTPGTKRDVLRTSNLAAGAALAFFPAGGKWASSSTNYTGATPSTAVTTTGNTTVTSGDAISLFDLDTWLHPFYEVLATMKLSTTNGAGKQVSFIIFDYQSATDFKYAGLDALNGTLRVGHRTTAGWVDDAVVSAKLNTNSNYSPTLTVNGQTATISFGNGNNISSASFTFSDPLNDGMIGLGTYGGSANFLNITVQQLPHAFYYNVSEDFSDGIPNGFRQDSGTWTTTSGTSGRFSAAVPVSGVALSTRNFVTAPLAYTEYSATVRANVNGTMAGLVFAVSDASNFLYAGIIPGTNQVVIGHVSNGVWTNDFVAVKTITANTDYTLLASLDRNTVNLVLNGVSVATFTYGATLVNQGRVGVFTKGGAGSFDNLLLQGEDVSFSNAGGSTVVGRNIFYNNSSFDGNSTAINAADNNAIATDKTALLPGGTASLVNYTSYSKGINGIMIDVSGALTVLTAADFTFKTGNSNTPAVWAALAAPPTIAVKPGAGINGSDRVEITFPDSVIKNTWLQITMLADANTGLSGNAVFYFGNVIGDTGDTSVNAKVTSADVAAIQSHLIGSATITSLYDINRDGKVDAADVTWAQSNTSSPATTVNLINLAGSAPVLPPVGSPATKAPSPTAATSTSSTAAPATSTSTTSSVSKKATSRSSRFFNGLLKLSIDLITGK